MQLQGFVILPGAFDKSLAFDAKEESCLRRGYASFPS